MTYQYEELGPERFQEFCQALLVSFFPNVQCLPVGQPDGGRDAFVDEYLLLRGNRGTKQRQSIVFQVKFARSPSDGRDERAFLDQVISSELPKVKRLIQKGARHYYLITNISGTAHPDVGSIDRINTYAKWRWQTCTIRKGGNQPLPSCVRPISTALAHQILVADASAGFR